MDPTWLDRRTLQINTADLERMVPHLPEGSALRKVRQVLTEGYEDGCINDLDEAEAVQLEAAMRVVGLRDAPYGWEASESYPAAGGAILAQVLYDTGLIYVVNAAVLHHHGFALAVQMKSPGGPVVGLALHRTDDPDGVWFDEELTVQARRKLREHGLVLQPPAVCGEAEEVS